MPATQAQTSLPGSPPDPAEKLSAGLDTPGSFGRFSRAISSVVGGIMLGSSFGAIPALAGGTLGAIIFTFAESCVRR